MLHTAALPGSDQIDQTDYISTHCHNTHNTLGMILSQVKPLKPKQNKQKYEIRSRIILTKALIRIINKKQNS